MVDVAAEKVALEAEIARLKAELAQGKAAGQRSLTLKVGQKGGLCIYGLGRFPVTLYRSQAERLFTPEMCAKVQAFISAHAAELKTKE